MIKRLLIVVLFIPVFTAYLVAAITRPIAYIIFDDSSYFTDWLEDIIAEYMP